jgi:DNA ligase (NAD+)
LACPAQLKRAVGHFGSRHALDIRGLGPEAVEALVSSGLVHSVADLFTLRARDLAKLDQFADLSAANLVRAIDTARHTTRWRFLHALGVPGVGAKTARDLADHFGSLDAIQSAGEAALQSAPGVGLATARAIAAFFQRHDNRRIIALCLRRGLELAGPVRARRGPLSGQTVVFTGSLNAMTREEAEESARAQGARTSHTVGRHTDLVVAGTHPGSNDAKARSLGIRIANERQFQKLLSRR